MRKNIRNAEYKNFKKYEVAKHYCESTFERIYEIFCTYRNRGGILNFSDFAYIPVKKDPGKNLDQETGIWTKGIRTSLATQGPSFFTPEVLDRYKNGTNR